MYKDNVSQHHDEDDSINSGNVNLKFLAHLVGGSKQNLCGSHSTFCEIRRSAVHIFRYSYIQRNSSLYINFHLLGMYTLK